MQDHEIGDRADRKRRVRPSDEDATSQSIEQIRKIVEECDPEGDQVDKRILYEWTGIKLKNSDYDDDTSVEEEGDISVFIDNLIGYSDS